MKILIYSLISFLLFLTSWCEDDEEGDCTKLEKEITVKIYAEMLDISESGFCEDAYTIDFWKVHCGGGPSATMSYNFKGCSEHDTEDDWKYILKQGIGIWSVTFKYEEDNLHVLVKDEKDQEIGPWGTTTIPIINGKKIYELTNGGSKGLQMQISISIKHPTKEKSCGILYLK